MTIQLDPAVLAALANVLPKDAKKSRDGLAAGEHEIDTEITLAIKGKVNVSADEEYTPTVKVPLKVTLALFTRYSGVTGPAAMKALTKAMTEALAIEKMTGPDKKNALKAIGEIADLEAAEAQLDAALFELPKANRVGKVNVKAAVEVVAAGSVVLVEGEAAEDEADEEGVA